MRASGVRLLTDLGKWHCLVNRHDLEELHRAILLDPGVRAIDNRKDKLVPRLLTKGILRLSDATARLPASCRVLRWLPKPLADCHVAVLMGPQRETCLPHFAFARRKSIYLFDAWPNSYRWIRWFTREHRLDHVFFSSSQSAEHFRAQGCGFESHWIPEGVEPVNYRFREPDERDIDVLSFGRKWDAYHDRIVSHLSRSGRLYLYEKVKGEVVYPHRVDFVDGLARARISICVPSSVTHPERSGDTCTMTMRYLQSMASKCVVVGITPPEMRRLFDYPPLVEIDMRDPAGQLDEILENYSNYLPLVERNYQEVCAHHRWTNRWESMRLILGEGMG